MDEHRFNAMVARLEHESRESPAGYKTRVAMLALLGFFVLLLILLFSGLGIALIAGVAAFAIFTGSKAALLILKLGKLLILLIAPLWLLLKSSLKALFTRLPAPQGREITRAEAPVLFAAIDDMRVRMKGTAFHHVLVTNEMNAAVVQRPLFGLFGFPRNYLVLGLPLLESLAPDEALSVIAHEYGHLSGAHAHFGAFIYRLRHTWSTIQAVASQWRGIAGATLRRVIGWYAPFFNAYTFVLARANEYEADAASAELVGPAVAANALKRVNVADAQYRQFLDRIYGGVRDSARPPEDLAEQWSRNARIAPAQALATRWLAESLNRESSAFDTHPMLRARLAALPGEAGSAATLPPPLAGACATDAWFGAAANSLRESQQRDWRAQVAERWVQRHDELQVQRQRLAELRAVSAPSTEQKLERLRLQVALEPDTDHLPELSAFNTEVPDCAPALYLEGDLRLGRDDDQGLSRLDQAMNLDADAIKPGCQRAYDYLTRRGDAERAKHYSQRWQQRHDWERQRAVELDSLDAAHELVTAELDPETLGKVRGLLAVHAEGVTRAWLARRVLPSDPSANAYVLGLQLTLWSRLRSRGPQIVSALARLEWPMNLIIFSLGHNKAVTRKLLRVPGANVYSAD